MKPPVASHVSIVGSSWFIFLLVVGYYGMAAFAANVFINYHRNLGVGGVYDAVFTPTNNLKLKGKDQIQDREFRSGLRALKGVVLKAARDGKRLRPYGAKWSVTEIPYTEDYMVDTRGLNYAKIGIENEKYVTRTYQGERQKFLVFTQSGVRVKYLYNALFREGLTLSTSGSVDGQTMGGSISTGTHNAAIHVGAMQDYVKGIHLVLSGRTVFLQRASDAVVTEEYMKAIGADELISNDDLFNAAVVSMGTFGVVHGYLIETEKLFRLKSQVKRFPLSKASAALSSLDIASLGFDLDDPSQLPWHFEAFINPYKLESIVGTSVRVMQKIPLSDDELDKIKRTAAVFDPKYSGQALMLVIGAQFNEMLRKKSSPEAFKKGDEVKQEIFGALNDASILLYLYFGGIHRKEGFPLELYGDPLSTSTETFFLPVSTTTMEPCVPLEDMNTTLSLINEVLYENPTPTAVHIRYLKQSKATLAQTNFDGINACFALNSVDTIEARVAYQKVGAALRKRQRRRAVRERNRPNIFENKNDLISFNYHWGKVLPMNDEWIDKSHGQRFKEWLNQRSEFLTLEERWCFSNDYTDALGLTGVEDDTVLAEL